MRFFVIMSCDLRVCNSVDSEHMQHIPTRKGFSRAVLFQWKRTRYLTTKAKSEGSGVTLGGGANEQKSEKLSEILLEICRLEIID